MVVVVVTCSCESYPAGKLVPTIAPRVGGVVGELEAGLFFSSNGIGTNRFDAQSDVCVAEFSGADLKVAVVTAGL